MKRKLHVVFSKTEAGSLDFHEIARGTWILGREPALAGEPVPPEVLKGIEIQTVAACDKVPGRITYSRAEIKYAMDFEAGDGAGE